MENQDPNQPKAPMTDKKPVVQTEGWHIIKSLIDQEVEIESKDLLDCPIINL